MNRMKKYSSIVHRIYSSRIDYPLRLSSTQHSYGSISLENDGEIQPSNVPPEIKEEGKSRILPWPVYFSLRTPSNDSLTLLQQLLEKRSSDFDIMFACNKLMKSCARNSDHTTALEIHKAMVGAGISPDEYTVGNLLRALATANHLTEAVDMLESLAAGSSGPRPNTVMVSTLLKYGRKLGDLSSSLRCRQVMRQEGIQPDPGTCLELLQLAASERNLDEITATWQYMVSREMDRSPASHSIRVSAMADCGDFQAAVGALHEFCIAMVEGQLSTVHWSNKDRKADRLSVHVAQSPAVLAKLSQHLGVDSSSALTGWWVGNEGQVAALGSRSKNELQWSYNGLLSRAVKSGKYELAKGLLRELCLSEVCLDNYSFNAWMRMTAKQADSVAKTGHIWRLMELSGLNPDGRSREALILALCNEGRVEAAEKLLNDLLDPSYRVNLRVVCNAILDVCAAQGDFERSLSVLSFMEAHEVSPDKCTFLSLFLACGGPRCAGADGGIWARFDVGDRVEALEHKMADCGIPHTSETVTAAIQVLGKENMLDEVRQRLEMACQTVDGSGKPLADVVLFNAAINACTQNGNVDTAMEFYREMSSLGIQPNRATFNILINGCSFANSSRPDMPLAFKLVDKMQSSHGLQPDAWTYNALIKVACHAQELETALQLLRKMTEVQIQPDLVSFHTILAAANHQGRIDVAEFVLEHMHRLGVVPDVTTCSYAVSAYVHEGRFDEAKDALKVMVGRMVAARSTAATGETLEVSVDGQGPASSLYDALHDVLRANKAEAVDGLSARELMEVGVENNDQQLLGKSLLAYVSALDGDCDYGAMEANPWAVRLHDMYGKDI